MKTMIVSLFDANHKIENGDLFSTCGLEITLMSKSATNVANLVLLKLNKPLLEENAILVYDSDMKGCSDYDHSTLDAIREALEDAFGKPYLHNSPIEYLGYVGYENHSTSHWGVWSRRVKVDDDYNILEYIE